MKKSTKVFRIILQIFVSVAFLGGAYSKLSGNPMEVSMFSTLHIDSTLMVLGVLEVLVAILVWFKKTRTFAILLGSAILGGAVAESISFSGVASAFAPAIILAVAWIIVWIDRCGSACHCNCQGCKDCVTKNGAPVAAPAPTPAAPSSTMM